MILIQLPLRDLDGRTGGNHARDRLACYRMGQRVRRPMPLVALLCAMTRRFAAPAEARHERAGTHVTNLSDGSSELVAFKAKRSNVRGFSHGVT
jgi:hypothetical protein